jgi:hypothetical protein
MSIAITKGCEIAFCRKQHLTTDNGRSLQTAARQESPRGVATKGLSTPNLVGSQFGVR